MKKKLSEIWYKDVHQACIDARDHSKLIKAILFQFQIANSQNQNIFYTSRKMIALKGREMEARQHQHRVERQKRSAAAAGGMRAKGKKMNTTRRRSVVNSDFLIIINVSADKPWIVFNKTSTDFLNHYSVHYLLYTQFSYTIFNFKNLFQILFYQYISNLFSISLNTCLYSRRHGLNRF